MAGLAGPLVLAAATCSQPQTIAGLLQGYSGKVALLRGLGDRPSSRIPVRAVASYGGQCDVAVQVASADFSAGELVFKLSEIGTAEIEGAHTSRCASFPTSATLVITGLGEAAPVSKISAAISSVLLTPEKLLGSYVIRTSESVGNPEAPLAQAGTIGLSSPKPLLSVYADYTEATRRLGVTGDVLVQATVGRDGRLYEVNLVNGLEPTLDERVLAVMPLWRFEPARVDGIAVAFSTNIVTTFRLR